MKTRRIAILGFGIEGKAILKFLRKADPGIKAVILDRKLDPHYLKRLKEFNLVYRSPGVPYNLPQLQRAIKKGVKFSSATDLFFKSASRRSKGIVIGITGTKGKSTVSTVIYQILKNAGRDVYLGGNIGKPAIDLLPKLKKNSITVLELSSFQLQDLKHSPQIAVILDVFPDHLDIHQSFKEYLEAKAPITKFQNSKNTVFYFPDNKYSRAIAQKSRGRKIPVSPNVQIPEIRIPGPHNRKNMAIVLAMAKHFKVPRAIIAKTLKNFRGLPYRLQLVRTIKGVRFYNDSASTNPQTTAAAIKSFPRQEKILIMGGKDKNLDYKPVAKILTKEKVKLVILFGENKLKIKRALPKGVKTMTATNLEQTVKLAFKSASSGNAVLFSPGAASFDMFENYKTRGKSFEKIVRNLK